MVEISTDLSVLESPIRKKIIQRILAQGGEISYQQAVQAFGNIGGRLDYQFSVLVSDGLLERAVRGKYRISPSCIQELRNLFGIVSPIALIGGIGKDLSLLTDLSQALHKMSIVPSHRVVITSPEIAQHLREDTLIDQTHLEIIVFGFQDILREKPREIKAAIQEWVFSHYLEYTIIADLTGGTKPVTIALFDLGRQYRWQLIYYSSRQLIWL
ncbi:MAG: hypothetical protein ACFE9L_19510 [Candidatus Hodarchaeota archaeon]